MFPGTVLFYLASLYMKKQQWFSCWALPPDVKLLCNHFHSHDFAKENCHFSLWKKIRSSFSKDFGSLWQKDIIHMVPFYFDLRDDDTFFYFMLTTFAFPLVCTKVSIVSGLLGVHWRRQDGLTFYRDGYSECLSSLWSAQWLRNGGMTKHLIYNLQERCLFL